MHQLNSPLSQSFRSQPIKSHQLTRTGGSFPRFQAKESRLQLLRNIRQLIVI
jgi:hypothetical protein